jgi:hypothetical protein
MLIHKPARRILFVAGDGSRRACYLRGGRTGMAEMPVLVERRREIALPTRN